MTMLTSNRATFWLSFASQAAGFLGVVLVDDCADLAEAVARATTAGVNPGGEVAAFEFDPDDHRMPAWERRAMAALPRLTLLPRRQIRDIAENEHASSLPSLDTQERT